MLVIPGIRTIVCNDFNSVVLPDTNAAAGESLDILSQGLLHHTSRWYRDQYQRRLRNAKKNEREGFDRVARDHLRKCRLRT